MAEFNIKQDDRLPNLRVALAIDGVALDLTSCTVVFKMQLQGTCLPETPLKISAPASVVAPPTAGIVEYEWAAGDTDTPGRYDAEFEVTTSGGLVFSTPTVGFLRVNVTESF